MSNSAASDATLSQNISVRLFSKAGQKIDEFTMRAGSNLWVFLRKRGHPIGSACSGVGVCGACHVTVHAGSNVQVTLQNEFERETLSRNSISLDQRLACLCRVFSDIDVSAEYW